MLKRSLFVLFWVSALAACGGDEEPSCQGANCGNNVGPVGTGDAGNSTPVVGATNSDSGAPAVTPGTTAGGVAAGGQAPGGVAAGGQAAGGQAAGGQAAGGQAAGGLTGGTKPSTGGLTGGGLPGGTTAGGGKDAGAPTPDVPSADAKPSAGCGKPAPMQGNAMIDVGGMARAYILALPANYDPMKPYKLIFAWHGLGGSADQIAKSGYYGLQSRAKDTVIFVTGQGLPTSGTASGAGAGGAGWANTNGQDVNFVKALYAQLQTTLCIDENRVFSTGMSYGGIMSNTLGCSMGDVFRAIAPMSGMGPGFGGRATCTGQVAVWMSNGDNDTVVSTSSERASKDFWVKSNHCMTTPMPTDPSPCQSFPGCDKGFPVTWCEFAGGHTVPQFAYAAIWTFFSQF